MKEFMIGLAVGMVGGIMLASCRCVQDMADDAKYFVRKDVVDPIKKCFAQKKRKIEKAVKDVENDVREIMDED